MERADCKAIIIMHFKQLIKNCNSDTKVLDALRTYKQGVAFHTDMTIDGLAILGDYALDHIKSQGHISNVLLFFLNDCDFCARHIHRLENQSGILEIIKHSNYDPRVGVAAIGLLNDQSVIASVISKCNLDVRAIF